MSQSEQKPGNATLFDFLLSMGYKDKTISFLASQKNQSRVTVLLCQSVSQKDKFRTNFDLLLSQSSTVEDLIKLLTPIAHESNSPRDQLITLHSLQTTLSKGLIDVTLYLVMLLIKQDDEDSRLILSEFLEGEENPFKKALQHHLKADLVDLDMINKFIDNLNKFRKSPSLKGSSFEVNQAESASPKKPKGFNNP